MEILLQRHTPDRSPVLQTALALLGIIVASAIGLSLFSAKIALGGDIVERMAVPGRMLVLVLLATLLLRRAGETWRGAGLRAPTGLFRCAGLVIGGYLAATILYAVLGMLVLPRLGLAPESAAMFAGIRGNLPELLFWLVFIAWGSAAFGEELLFRGFVQPRIERIIGATRKAAVFAVFAQAVIFGALHAYLGAGGAILAAATGLVLGAVYLLAGRNLWPCIILHGLIDTVSLTAIYFGAA